MPEGDTVFLAGHRLNEALAGKTLLRAELRHPRLSTSALRGQTVLGVRSVGKHLLMRFSGDVTLHSHLRMDGAWHLYRPGDKWQRPGHQVRAVFEVDDRVVVGFALHDMELVSTADEDQLVGHLGPDLLDPNWSEELFAEAVRRLMTSTTPLGPTLLNQRLMAGVGNLYKSEVCFLLKASPWRPMWAVDVEKAVRLSRKLLLANAWHPEQTTTGQQGRDRKHWVFERGGKPCRRCGIRISVDTQGDDYMARIAYWCPNCQP